MSCLRARNRLFVAWSSNSTSVLVCRFIVVFIVCPEAVRIRRAARSRTNTKFLRVRAPTRDGPARRAHTSSGLSSEIEASRAGDFAARVCRLCAPPSALPATGRGSCARNHPWLRISSSGFTRPAAMSAFAFSQSGSSRPAAMSSSISLSHFASR